MNLTEKQKEALEAIRTKVEKQDTSWKNLELENLEMVYSVIVKSATGKEEILDKTCAQCITRAVKIVFNYITYHELKERFKPVKATISEPGGTMESDKFYERAAKLSAIGFIINESKSVFEKSEEVNDLTLTVSIQMSHIRSWSDEDFEALLVNISDLDTNEISSDEIVIRIEALLVLGFEYQDEAYISNITGTEIKIDSIKTMNEEEWKSFIDAEEVLKQTKASIPPVTKQAKTESKLQLDYNKERNALVIIQEGKEPVPFDGDISKLDYNKVLWPLARKKGFTGSKPPKAELVEYLS